MFGLIALALDDFSLSKNITVQLKNEGYSPSINITDINQLCDALDNYKDSVFICSAKLQYGNIFKELKPTSFYKNNNALICISNLSDKVHLDYALEFSAVSLLTLPINQIDLVFAIEKAQSQIEMRKIIYSDFNHYVIEKKLTKEDIKYTFSLYLKKIRYDLGSSQLDFSHILEISERQLQRLESGRANFTIDTFNHILIKINILINAKILDD